MVRVKFVILHRHQGVDQHGRHLVQLDQYPVLVVRRIDAADPQRIEARQGDGAGVAEVAQVVEQAVGEFQMQRLGVLRTVGKGEGARHDIHIAAAAAEAARLQLLAGDTVIEQVEFRL